MGTTQPDVGIPTTRGLGPHQDIKGYMILLMGGLIAVSHSYNAVPET